jgi:hypothetical protein
MSERNQFGCAGAGPGMARQGLVVWGSLRQGLEFNSTKETINVRTH